MSEEESSPLFHGHFRGSFSLRISVYLSHDPILQEGKNAFQYLSHLPHLIFVILCSTVMVLFSPQIQSF